MKDLLQFLIIGIGVFFFKNSNHNDFPDGGCSDDSDWGSDYGGDDCGDGDCGCD